MDDSVKEEIASQLSTVANIIEFFVPDWFDAICDGDIQSSASGLAIFDQISDQMKEIVCLLLKAHGLDCEETISESTKIMDERTDKLVSFFETQAATKENAQWN